MSYFRQMIAACAVLSSCVLVFDASSASEDFEHSSVFIQVGYMNGDTFTKVEEGTGFLVHPRGWVLTAKHVINATVPNDKQRVFFGSVSSRFDDRYQLFDIPTASVAADVALLSFSPALNRTWPHLKIINGHVFSNKDRVAAAGYPSGDEITVKRGHVSNLFGPKGYIGVDVGLAPGMSGGPVVIENTKCVIGLVAAGSPNPTFDYIVPVQYVRPLLDTIPVEYITEVAAPTVADATGSPPLFERSYQVDETRTDHELTKTSQYYSRDFNADPGSTVVSARYVENSAASASDKTLNISPDRKSVNFRFKLESGPLYDQTRGWWHGQVILSQQKDQGVKSGDVATAVRNNCE